MAGAREKKPTLEPLITKPIANALFDSKYMLTISIAGRYIMPRLAPSKAP